MQEAIVLTAHLDHLGRGVAMLVTAWEYPADPALLPLTRELLRVVSAGEQDDIRLLAGDRVLLLGNRAQLDAAGVVQPRRDGAPESEARLPGGALPHAVPAEGIRIHPRLVFG